MVTSKTGIIYQRLFLYRPLDSWDIRLRQVMYDGTEGLITDFLEFLTYFPGQRLLYPRLLSLGLLVDLDGDAVCGEDGG